MLIAEADAPMFDHGETDDKRMPVPNGQDQPQRGGLQIRPQVPPVIQSGILNTGKACFCPSGNTSQLVATAGSRLNTIKQRCKTVVVSCITAALACGATIAGLAAVSAIEV
jgi:hypothetical protein